MRSLRRQAKGRWAKALNVKIPQAVLFRADETIR
jgi:hypothetical protein